MKYELDVSELGSKVWELDPTKQHLAGFKITKSGRLSRHLNVIEVFRLTEEFTCWCEANEITPILRPIFNKGLCRKLLLELDSAESMLLCRLKF